MSGNLDVLQDAGGEVLCLINCQEEGLLFVLVEVEYLLLYGAEHARLAAPQLYPQDRAELAVELHDADGGEADVLHVVEVWVEALCKAAQGEGLAHAGACGNLPKIKLPHFSINGEFSLSPPSIPKIGVEWYKKAMDNPVIMEKPTAFGINSSGQIMAGGEAGSEVVSGTETLMSMISAAVAENNGKMNEFLIKIYDLLAQYIPDLVNRQVLLDTGALVGEMAGPMNEELGRIAHMRGRRN